MKKIMLVGRTSCGKTTFSQKFHSMPIKYKKTQSVEIMDNIIDTPGEYLENRSLYRALSVTSVEADVIVLMQACDDLQNIFAPSFSNMFNQKLVIGIVSKIDLAKDKKNIIVVEKKLEVAGAKKIFRISSTAGIGVSEIKEFLIKYFQINDKV